MKKTLTALATASALLFAGAVSAECAYHKSGGSYGTGKAVMHSTPYAGGLVLTGQQDTMKTEQSDIVDTAIAAGSFNTLLKAAQEAGLVETLKGEGPYTVFAPTDAAFAKLPAGTVEALLADKQQLVKVLTYHVVPGRLDASQVTAMTKLATVEGTDLPVSSISITSTDITTSNGVIHVIDEVLIPQS